MWVTDILKSHRLPGMSKIRLISYRCKRFIIGKTSWSLKINKEEKFLKDFYNHLVHSDGILIKYNKKEYLVKYKLPALGVVNLYVRNNPASDLEVYQQVFENLEYQAIVDQVFSYMHADQVKFIMDAGANVGYTTIFLKKHFPDANFICIEPEEGNFQQLKKNIEINKLDKVNNLKAGLWHREEALEISSNFRDKKDWSFQVIESNKADTIPGYTVHGIMDLYGWKYIDILKIDIEGSERFVFGNRELMEKFLPMVKFIIIEIHDEYEIRESIYSNLKSFNFNLFEAGESTIGINTSLIAI